MRGEFWFSAKPEEVWSALAGLEFLRQSIPSCERLEPDSANELTAKLTIRIGRTSRALETRARVADADPPNAAELVGETLSSDAESLRWRAKLDLQPDHEGTLLAYAIDIDPLGPTSINRSELEAAGRDMLDRCFCALSLKIIGASATTRVLPADDGSASSAASARVDGMAKTSLRHLKRAPLWLWIAVFVLIGLRLLAYFQS
jgi:carbon monoxide dehydrogenase subunit G